MQKIAVVLSFLMLLWGCAQVTAQRALDEVCVEDPMLEQCISGIPAETRFYAAIMDYNAVKGIAVAYAEAPSTPRSHILRILDVVEMADVHLEAILAAQKTDTGVSEQRYLVAASVLRSAVIQMNAQIARGEIIHQ